MRRPRVRTAAAYGAAVLVAAMGTEAWPGVRSGYAGWAGGLAAVLDEHAARLADRDDADRDDADRDDADRDDADRDDG